jgi:DNA-binding transcriptional LysR family regulator
MRITQLRQADLNLFVVFVVLAEERSVSRAATRLLLSQPAVSRALQRLRATFDDELLLRTPSGYELTAQGQRLLQELEVLLPRMDRLLSGATFDPDAEEATFRVAATDNATHILCPPVCRLVLPRGRRVTFDFVPLDDGSFSALDHGRLDLVLNAEDGNTPARFSREILFEDRFVCVVAKESKYARKITLEQYLDAPHIGVSVLGGVQTIPERRLAAVGKKRRIVVRVPYFTAAIRSVAATELVATVPERIARAYGVDPRIRVIAPPPEMSGFTYLMAWHPRVSADAAHTWLRETMRQVGRSLGTARGSARRLRA